MTRPESSIPIKVPDLGTGSDEIRISAWLIEIGQTVISGDRVVEVVVPGITFDIESPTDGELVEMREAVDSIVQQGDILGWIQPMNDGPDLELQEE